MNAPDVGPKLGRDVLIAGVLAATDKLVGQVGNGDWQSANKTVADRRLLLEQLASQEPQPGEHDFLRALREAAAESEAALRAMHRADASQVTNSRVSSSQAASGRLNLKA